MSVLETVILGIVGKLGADEIKAWLPRLVIWLKDRAVERLPPEYQPRYEEEWASSLEEIPGDLSKLLYAFSLLRASSGIKLLASEGSRGWLRRSLESVVAIVALVAILPVGVAIAISIRLTSRGPIFSKHRRAGADGVEFTAHVFRAFQEETGKSGSQITPVGAFLTRFDLHCLPLLLNVVSGDLGLTEKFPRLPSDESESSDEDHL
jgi:Bacterial sugar transferase